MSLARGDSHPSAVMAGHGCSRAELESWVAEFVHASPEHFDEGMLHNLAEHGLLQAEAMTQQSGRIGDVDPLDLLQSLGIYRRAGHVLFFHPHGISQLWFEDGDIVDARSGALHGTEAIHRIVMHDDGDFRVEVTGVSRPRVITASVSALVLEAASQLDEARRLLPQLPASDVVLRLRPRTDETDGSDVAGGLAQLFVDGTTLDEVLERSPLTPVATLRHVARLVALDRLVRTGEIREPEVPSIQRRALAVRTVVHETSSPFVPAVRGRAPASRGWRRRVPLLLAAAAGLLLTAGALTWWMGGDEARPREPIAAATPAPVRTAEPSLELASSAAPSTKIAVAPAPSVEPIAVAAPMPADGDELAIDAKDSAAIEPDAPTPEADTSPRSARRRSSKSRRRTPSPTVEPSSSTTTEPAKSKPKDAATLLAEARSAYNSGRGSAAYKLASESNRLRPSPETAEILTLSACQMNAPDKAERALRLVPLLRRSAVRSTCKKRHSVKL